MTFARHSHVCPYCGVEFDCREGGCEPSRSRLFGLPWAMEVEHEREARCDDCRRIYGQEPEGSRREVGPGWSEP